MSFGHHCRHKLPYAALNEMDGIKANVWAAPGDKFKNDIRAGVSVLGEQPWIVFTDCTINLRCRFDT